MVYSNKSYYVAKLLFGNFRHNSANFWHNCGNFRYKKNRWAAKGSMEGWWQLNHSPDHWIWEKTAFRVKKRHNLAEPVFPLCFFLLHTLELLGNVSEFLCRFFLQTNKQTNKKASKQTRKERSKRQAQTNERTNKQANWKDLGSFSSTTNSEQFKSNQCRLSQPFCQWLEPGT